jgi:hypothetical protein
MHLHRDTDRHTGVYCHVEHLGANIKAGTRLQCRLCPGQIRHIAVQATLLHMETLCLTDIFVHVRLAYEARALVLVIHLVMYQL